MNIEEQVARELGLRSEQVARTLALLDGGATVPFVARYRKEATSGLDEVQIAAVRDRRDQLSELESRRAKILESLEAQGQLTAELRARIDRAGTKAELEDLYLPFRPKRRTRATVAREAGYEPLADLIWAQADRLARPADVIAAEYGDPQAAWQGARDIVAERVAEDPDVRAELREHALGSGRLASRKARATKKKAGTVDFRKYETWFDFAEPVRTVPSHRVLALGRGEKEGALSVSVEVDRATALSITRRRIVRNPRAALARQLEEALVDGYDRLLAPSIESHVRGVLRERAEADAIRVFADNLWHMLMAAPLGPRRTLALDPGFRTGCKVVVLDETGALLTNDVVYPHEPQKRVDEARRKLSELARRHRVGAVAVGNGTAGRETLALVKAMNRDGELPEGTIVVSVNESGASVYSASEVARAELPDQDLTVRGAVSIGRRLQDPLAELVKIDPKSIGVGQYQHDVDQGALQKGLGEVVERCVNRVGVEVNTASAQLLAHVAGIGPALASNVVARRNAKGPFRTRRDLLDVPRLGSRAFEQAAGFLRVRGGPNPLDASAVHPESYGIVERMAADLGVEVARLVGNAELARRVDAKKYVGGAVGEPTVMDILAELEKPGRDPRASFEEVAFREDVTEIEHLEDGMILEGVVTNVTSFGAFVDVGVHQDGLVHVSQLADRFVRDPAEVVKVGDRVKVKVLSVDLVRRRIALSMREAGK